MENWRNYQEAANYEREFELFFEHHFCQLDEGFIDWAVSKGKGIREKGQYILRKDGKKK